MLAPCTRVWSKASKKFLRAMKIAPSGFLKGKPLNEGEFLSENQRPITCLNNMYKWFASCLVAPMDQNLEHYCLVEGQQRGAKSGCFGTMDNLLIDRAVMLDCQRGKHNLIIDDLKVFAASESKLNRVLKETTGAMQDIGLHWNQKKCSVVHVKRGAQVLDESGMRMDEKTLQIPGCARKRSTG